MDLQDCGSDVDLDAKVDAEFETAAIDVVLKEIFKGKVTDRSGEREYFMSER